MADYKDPRPSPTASAADPCVIYDNAVSFNEVVNGDTTVTTYTGKELLTLSQAIDKFGFGVASFTFAVGGTLESLNLLVSNSPADGFLYKYVGAGSAPITVTAGTDPTISVDWQAFAATSHELLSDLNAAGGHDAIYPRNFDTVSAMQSYSGHVVGRTVETKSFTSGDKGAAKYEILAAGSAGNVSSLYITLSDGKRAKLIHSGVIHADQVGASSDPLAVRNLLIDIRVLGLEYITLNLEAENYSLKDAYSHNFNLGAGPFVGNTAKGLKINGAKMPNLSSDGKQLENGTVLQGTLFNLADGFECYDLGVDFGTNVVANVYAGVYGEGFVPCANTDYPNPQPKIKNLTWNNIISLIAEPVVGNSATLKHSTLAENGQFVNIGYTEAIGGTHCFVSKCEDLFADTIIARGGGNTTANDECVIFKSDPANTCKRNYVKNLTADQYTLDGTPIKCGGVVYQTSITNPTTEIVVTNLTMKNSVKAIRTSGSGVIDSCYIDNLHMDGVVGTGLNVGDQFRFLTINKARAVNVNNPLVMGSANKSTSLGDWTVVLVGADSNTKFTLNGDYTHGKLNVDTSIGSFSGTSVIQRTSGDLNPELLKFGNIDRSKYYSSLNVIATAANLANGWTEKVISNFKSFKAIQYGGKIHLQGRLIPPASNVNPFTLSAALFTESSQNRAIAETSTFGLVPARIDVNSTSGQVTVSGISTFQGGYVVLDGIEIPIN